MSSMNMKSIFKSDQSSHSRLLHAPSVDMKFDWLALMMQLTESLKQEEGDNNDVVSLGGEILASS
jgi:hypothetical protein